MNGIICTADKAHRTKEKSKAKALRNSVWWKALLAQGICYYCQKKFLTHELTMDHKIPIARGGKSTRSNIVVCCFSCNQKKSHKTLADIALEQLLGE